MDTIPVGSDLASLYGLDDIIQIQKAENDKLVDKYKNVVGTGVGVRIVDGQFTEERALILFVREKVKQDGLVKLSLDQVAPRSIGGVAVDVIEVGDLVKHAGFSRRARPISPGFSISQENVTAGTLGGLFIDADGDIVALSNNHVLADENRAEIGDPIYQPGIADMPPGFDLKFRGFNEPVQNLPYFATLKRYIRLQPGGASNYQDSAIAKIDPAIIRDKMLIPIYPNGRPMAGLGEAIPGRQVQKFGRTSGHTQGTVLSLHSKFSIGYDMGQVSFEDCIVCTSMSRGGDSGSVLLDADMKAIGLLFAGSDKVTVFHPIQTVVKEYGLRPWLPDEASPGGGDIEFWGRHWKPVYPDGMITLNPKNVLIMEATANQHAFVETPVLPPVHTVSVDIFTGSDQGTSWGPGIAVTFPNGVFKLNVRYNQGFGATWNGQEFISKLKSSEPNRWYSLRIRITQDWVTADVTDKTANNGKWFKIVELPANKIQGDPLTLRLGKLDDRGGGGDGDEVPGPSGRSQLANLVTA